MNGISNETITSCTNLCTNFKNQLNTRTNTIINDITMKLEKHEAKNALQRNKQWTTLENTMKKTITQLSNTNSIAIKNNKILVTKIDNAKKKIEEMQETINLQEAMIETMTATINSNDNRLAQLRNHKHTEYQSLVDTVATRIISTAVEKECTSILSKPEI